MKSGRMRVLFFEDRYAGCWSAQCLDHDIATQAKTLPELYYELHRLILGHLIISVELQREPFAGLPKAPQKFWDIYRQSSYHLQVKRNPFRVPQKFAGRMPVPDLRIADLQAV